jgi:RNA 2',3'-cyclic 3'-phosphodiesterase
MQRIGLQPERKYKPHVTLARLRDTSSRQVAEFLSTRQPFRSSSFPVSRFVLYSNIRLLRECMTLQHQRD